MRSDSNAAPRASRAAGLATAGLALGLFLTALQVPRAEASPVFGTHADTPLGFAAEAMSYGDLDGDGRPDLVVTNSSLNAIMVLMGNWSGGFTAKLAFSGVGQPLPTAVGDLNADGKPDLAVGNAGPTIVQYFPGSTQKFTLIHYVKSLLPFQAEQTKFLVFHLEPSGAAESLVTLLLVAAVFLTVTTVVFQKKEYVIGDSN